MTSKDIQGQRVGGEAGDRVQFNDDGSLDEVVVQGMGHLEQLADNHWWLGLTRPDGSQMAIWLYSKKRIKVSFEERPATRRKRPEHPEHETEAGS